MDERTKKIVDNFDTMKIGADDPFKFHCTMCGQCCIHREDILLSPSDLYNMAKELDITVTELYKEYCESYVGSDSRMPIVRLRPRGPVKRCPLLKDRKCMVQKAKPAICAMFPIGRYIMAQIDPKDPENHIFGGTQYIFTNPGCGDDGETHTVREWLESFDIPVEDVAFKKWQQIILELSSVLRDAEKTTEGRLMELAWRWILVFTYLDYDTQIPFLPQFEKNAENTIALVHRTLAYGK